MKEALIERGHPAEKMGNFDVAKPQRYCVFIPGLGATQADMHAKFGIHTALVAKYGEGNVSTFNSVVSSDKPDPEHFSKIADVIMTQAKIGPIDIVMHSLGSTEFLYIKKIIKKRDKNFFRDPQVKANIRLEKIGESGNSIGLRERITFAKDVARINSDTRLKTPYAFPIKDVAFSKVTEIFSRKSNKRTGYTAIPFENARTNENFLTPQEKAAKNTYDIKLGSALAENKLKKAKRIGKQRDRMLKKPLRAVFAGTPQRSTEKKRIQIGGFQGVRVLLRALGNKPIRELRKLYHEGFTVDSLVPEFDILPINRVVKFYDTEQDAKKHTRVMQGAPHEAFALQVDLWADALKAKNY